VLDAFDRLDGDRLTDAGLLPLFCPELAEFSPAQVVSRCRGLSTSDDLDSRRGSGDSGVGYWIDIVDERGVCWSGPKGSIPVFEGLYAPPAGEKARDGLTGFAFSSQNGTRLPKSILYASPLEGSMSMRSLHSQPTDI